MDVTEMNKALYSFTPDQKRVLAVFVSYSVTQALVTAIDEITGFLNIELPNEDEFEDFLGDMRKFLALEYAVCPEDESPLETELRRALQSDGVWFDHDFQQQYEVANFRTDFAVPDKRVIIECVGLEYHSGKQSVAEDARRYTYFSSRGWNVLIFSGNDILHHRSDCVETIKFALLDEKEKEKEPLDVPVRVMSIEEVLGMLADERNANEEVIFHGTIVHVYRKDPPSPWWVHIEDQTGIVTNCSVFPERRQIFQDQLQNGATVYCSGKIGIYGNGRTVINLSKVWR